MVIKVRFLSSPYSNCWGLLVSLMLAQRGVVEILIACDAAVDGLAEQIGERKLCILPAPSVGKVLGD
jgi:hypothetical protein